MKVIARKAFPYNGRRIAVGDVFDASDKNARILKALRRVDFYVEPSPAPVARPRRKASAATIPPRPAGDFSAFRRPIPPGPNAPATTPAPVLVPMAQDASAQDASAQDASAQDAPAQDAPAQDAPAQDAADGEYRRRDLRAED